MDHDKNVLCDNYVINFIHDATSDLIDDNDEYCLNMLYDNALDDGPILIDNPLCLKVEDKNDIIDACDGTLTHESPTFF